MSIPSPNLDDRSFQELVDEAKQKIALSCPRWNDLTPSDPGVVLLEVYAYLTELMLYRLNRVPEKVFIEFLNLMGVKIEPPSAAGTILRFSREDNVGHLEIPKGTRVAADHATDGGEPPVFRTQSKVVMEEGQESVEVEAYHYDFAEGELLGVGSGLPGQQYQLKNFPAIAAIEGEMSLVLAIETDDNMTSNISWQSKSYEIWNEVNDFTNVSPHQKVFMADRRTGMITFSPAIRQREGDGHLSDIAQTLAMTPPNDKEIRAWYCYGGGLRGNVPADSLTVMKDNISGVEVSNPKSATGGVNSESVENALVRGPKEVRTLNRAITASDFELLAVGCTGAVSRAKAFTANEHWAFAKPGTVSVVLVPDLDVNQRENEKITISTLESRETDDALERVEDYLNQRKAMGTQCQVSWARYKTIKIRARVVVQNQENIESLKQRIHRRLNKIIQPLPTSLNETGWPFGEPMYVSEIYNILLDEPGVIFADRVRLIDEEVPNHEVRSVSADHFQEKLWYAEDGDKLYRSTNEGVGWEVIYRFEEESIQHIHGHPSIPGLVALITEHVIEVEASEEGDEEAPEPQSDWLVYVSHDCGETWNTQARLSFRIRDFAWFVRDGQPMMFLATDQGLYELDMTDTPTPLPIMVDDQHPVQGFWTVSVATLSDGDMMVAAAAQNQGGVYLSRFGGKSQTYDKVGLEGDDVRILKVQTVGPNRYLWAGLYAYGNQEGDGCFRKELNMASEHDLPWVAYNDNWQGGSCFSLDFSEARVFAATHHGGVMELNLGAREPMWSQTAIDCGLALRDVGRFDPVYCVSASKTNEGLVLMASGPQGVFRTDEVSDYTEYDFCSNQEYLETLTLPSTWLFCSGEHDIDVLHEYETK